MKSGMNIFSLLIKYAADRQQTENQFTLSLVSILSYHRDYFKYLIEELFQLLKIKPTSLTDLSLINHHPFRVKIEGQIHNWIPDLLIKNMDKNILVFEMKIKDRQIQNNQKLYGKKAKCPLIFLTEHKEVSQKSSILNITWNDIGKISDKFLEDKNYNRKYKLLQEYVDFLKERKMYLPDSIVTRANFDHLSKFIGKSSDSKKYMVRGIKESLHLLQWGYDFIESCYDDIITNFKCLNKFNFETRYWHQLDYGEKHKTKQFRSLYIYGHVFRYGKSECIGINYGWNYDEEYDEWCFYTAIDMHSKNSRLLNKYIKDKDEVKYRDKDIGLCSFKNDNKDLRKSITAWRKETLKLAKVFINSKFYKRANTF